MKLARKTITKLRKLTRTMKVYMIDREDQMQAWSEQVRNSMKNLKNLIQISMAYVLQTDLMKSFQKYIRQSQIKWLHSENALPMLNRNTQYNTGIKSK